MSVITLTTDFGLRDPDLGYLKSLILQVLPNANLIDISHASLPFDPDEAIYIVKNALQGFPKGTIHWVGIDSETHIDNRPILIVNHQHFYLANDNGIITAALSGTDFKVFALPFSKPGVFMEAHLEVLRRLSKGVMPDDFAQITQDYKTLKLSKPLLRYDDKTQKVALVTPKVIYNDNYGNAIFNLSRDEFEKWRDGRKFSIKLRHYEINEISQTYWPEHQTGVVTTAGTMYARFNHFGYLEIFIYKSNRKSGGADTLLSLHKNQIVNIVFES